jgi:hypothetical protein
MHNGSHLDPPGVGKIEGGGSCFGGWGFDGIICDEFANWRPGVGSEVLRPALSDRQGLGRPNTWGRFNRAAPFLPWAA